MTLLLLGIVLFIAGHMIRRLMPVLWSALVDRLGLWGARAVTGTIVGIGTVFIILGYRAAPFEPVYDPPVWTIHLNNLLMLGAVGLVAAGLVPSRVRTWLRYPILTGVAVWAVAHLLVNGDLASILLFGTMGVWAVATIPLIGAAEGPWQRPAAASVGSDLRLVAVTVAAFVLITGVHAWLGYWPFPR